MTATLTVLPPPLIGSCPKRWCIESDGCMTTTNPHNGFFHYGRYSTVTDNFRRELNVVPSEYVDEENVESAPHVEVSLSDDITIDLSTETAWAFSATLAAFAAGKVPVGEEVSFADQYGDASLTLKRLSDEVFEYGNGAPRYMSFGAVELVFDAQREHVANSKAGLSGPDAEQFARFVAGVVREVSS